MIVYKPLLLSTEKKRIRAFCSSYFYFFPIPCLLDIQTCSYERFLNNVSESILYDEYSLESVLSSIFPIFSYTKYNVLEFLGHKFESSNFTINECKIKNKTYAMSLQIRVRLIIYDKNFTADEKIIKRVVEQEVYICELPVMVSRGIFIINGIERVIVSQLYRSPGILFEVLSNKIDSFERLTYTARIIPYRGSWLDFELDYKDFLYIHIDRKRKIPVTILLKSLGYSVGNILKLFFNFCTVRFCQEKNVEVTLPLKLLYDQISFCDILKNNKIIIKKGIRITDQHIVKFKKDCIVKLIVLDSFLYGHLIASDVLKIGSTSLLYGASTCITEVVISNLRSFKISCFYLIYCTNIFSKKSIVKSLEFDLRNDVKVVSKMDALFYIHRILRPTEQPTTESAIGLFNQLFFDNLRYDLSLVGVLKFNYKIGKDVLKKRILTKESIVLVIKRLLNIKNGYDVTDDVDHMINRRIRGVGELIENQFRNGFSRVEKSIREKLTYTEVEVLTPRELINPKFLIATLNEFFCSSQLSQFMDQTNPLSGLTHQRRISSLGLGGLSRDRAGFEVRDVHYTHYGRLCPVETPEGPNIGLVNSPALYTKVSSYGFLETPYYKVKNRKVGNKVYYLSAIEEKDCVVASANVLLSLDKYIINKFLLCRYNDVFKYFNSDDVDYIDVSTQQVFSVAAALIPFLEHDDANRALMGSNMQRQAVPLLFLEKPLIGTGVEGVFSENSYNILYSGSYGYVHYVDASQVVLTNGFFQKMHNLQVDVYNLLKYAKTNQNTCINQRALVRIGEMVKKNDVIVDGFATDVGELALGKNVLVGFMSWYGYNFEDSIVVSDRLIQDDIFTSAHIEEFVCLVRDTRLGAEEIMIDIPNITTQEIRHLDKFGIVCVGSVVHSGDILVGKVTPVGEVQPTPEEKLLRAIFGEKASEVKDTSLRVPRGVAGVVVDVQVYIKVQTKQDDFLFFEENNDNLFFKYSVFKEFQLKKDNLFRKVKNFLLGKELLMCTYFFVYGCYITQRYLKKFLAVDWFKFIFVESFCNEKLFLYYKEFIELKKFYENSILKYKNKFDRSDNLAPGVLKVVKVFITTKRILKVGDKMSGRHGNKGVVAVITPVENMPYLDDGTPLDMILNPLSVPSRMNIGQIFEAHFGLAMKVIGVKLYEIYVTTKSRDELQKYVDSVYNICSVNLENRVDFFLLSDCELIRFINSLKNGFPVATPIFSGISEKKIKMLLDFVGLPMSGQVNLTDGFTGDVFRQNVTVGFVYMLKLNHLVDDKMHARSVGAYSLITQQPLGGKAQFGGQRFGEMEVWALEAYGAAYILQEMLTVKSDDVVGRVRVYKNIVDNDYFMVSGIPESFNVLIKEIRSLGLNIEFS